jgi:hypothetical protein
MGLEAAIVTTAEAHAGLIALIKTGSVTRIYPVVAPQSTTYPLVTYRVISQQHDEAMGTTSTVIRRRVEFHVQDNSANAYSDTIDVSAQLIDCFNRFSGTVGGFVIHEAFIDNVTDLAYDLDSDVYTRVVDIIFACGA